MKKSIKKNAVLNTIKTLLKIIFPLITIPYISRVLNVNNIGKYNFSFSIVSYFILLAQLGIDTFAVREGAKYRDSREKLSEFTSKVYSINIISTVLSYVLLIICIFTIPKLNNYSLLIGILSIQIILNTLGCEWLYTINEDYKYITIRTIVMQVFSLLLLFIFVRTEGDLINYCITTVIASSGANLLNIINIRKYCDLKIKITKDLKNYLLPIILLFVNSVATTIYVHSDMTLLGIFSSDYYVGLYSISSKVYATIKTLLSAIIIVSIPRLSYFIGNKKIDEYKQLAIKIINSLVFLVLPTMIGIISISDKIIYIIAGKNFIMGNLSLKILGVSLIFSIFSWFYTSCVLIPLKREKDVLIATCTAAIINIILNIFLIPKYNQDAAALTTVIAEMISLIICYFKSRKIIKLRIPIKNIIKVIVGCIGIFVYCYIINRFVNVSCIYSLIINVLGSTIIYMLLELILKNETLIYYLNMIKEKILIKK